MEEKHFVAHTYTETKTSKHLSNLPCYRWLFAINTLRLEKLSHNELLVLSKCTEEIIKKQEKKVMDGYLCEGEFNV